MFANIRKQKEHAFQMGYQQSRIDMGLRPVPAPELGKPAPAASEIVMMRRTVEAIRRFGVAEDGVVTIPAETLDAILFMLRGADDAPAGH